MIALDPVRGDARFQALLRKMDLEWRGSRVEGLGARGWSNAAPAAWLA